MLLRRHISVCCLDHFLSLFVVCVLRVKGRTIIGQQNPSVRLNHNRSALIGIQYYLTATVNKDEISPSCAGDFLIRL